MAISIEAAAIRYRAGPESARRRIVVGIRAGGATNVHILLAVLSAIGAIGIFLIRANLVHRAARDLVGTASDVKAAVRRSWWRRKTKVDLTRELSDPRLAATAMMQAVACSDGDMTERQKAAILDEMVRQLQMDAQAAQEMFVYGRWLISEVMDLSSFLNRASRSIAEQCTVQEQRRLLHMLESVAKIEVEVSPIQADAIERLRHRLLPNR